MGHDRDIPMRKVPIKTSGEDSWVMAYDIEALVAQRDALVKALINLTTHSVKGRWCWCNAQDPHTSVCDEADNALAGQKGGDQ